ncbi:MAG TPA: hypothetical protein VGX23_28185 [Actinocrinis sp.]|nr:hypothetical protein [Actinocrinis sp.]
MKLITRCVMTVTALALALLGVSTPAHAAGTVPGAARPNVTARSTAACVPSSVEYCLTAVPSHGSGASCTPFPNGMFWQDATDSVGNPVSWTYANGSSPCVTVTFSAEPLLKVCTFWLYVPEGEATATFTLGWKDTAGNSHTTEPVNEDSVYGWSQITMFNPSQRGAAKVTQLHFSDGNGQSYPSQLGWGRGGGFGIAQVCA